jgi:hypothetical protein
MNIQLKKIERIRLVQETENPSIITDIKKIFQSEKKDWWYELSDEQKADLDRADSEFDNGDFVSFDGFFTILSKK